MRDDRNKWAPAGLYGQEIDLGLTAMSRVHLERQTLMSGPDLASRSVPPCTGWPDVVADDVYTIALRRDRLLEINGADRQEGWHEEQNMAVSDVSHAYSVFDLIGPGAMELLQRGTEIRLDQPSKSAVRRFFGFEVILYRVQSETRFRLHIANAHDHALCEFLTKAANAF